MELTNIIKKLTSLSEELAFKKKVLEVDKESADTSRLSLREKRNLVSQMENDDLISESEYNKEVRKLEALEKNISKLEEKIESCESRISEIEEIFENIESAIEW